MKWLFKITILAISIAVLVTACGSGGNSPAGGDDTTAPTTPTNLVATTVSSSQINLSWDAATDNVGVAGYKIYRDGVYLKSVTGITTSDTGLSANTQYCYKVLAYDEANNESSQSAQSCATANSVVIVCNVAPDDFCELEVQTSATDATYYVRGLLDLAAGTDYYMAPQIDNYMLNNSNTNSEDLSAMAVQIEYFDITYSWLDGSSIIALHQELANIENQEPYLLYMAGTIPAAVETGEPGRCLLIIDVFKPGLLELLQTLGADMDSVVLGVHLKLHGHTLHGESVTSNEFVYPIYFCSGCTLNQQCCMPGQDSCQPISKISNSSQEYSSHPAMLP